MILTDVTDEFKAVGEVVSDNELRPALPLLGDQQVAQDIEVDGRAKFRKPSLSHADSSP
jgi:hypothetical protein